MLLTFGLFETAADVHAAIRDLDQAGFGAGKPWLLTRNLEADTGEQDERRTTVARALVELDLADSACYFDTTGLVVIPEEGAYLVAGWPIWALTSVATEGEPGRTELCRALIGIGCGTEEAGFLEGRLQAGTMLLGVADSDEERLEAVREIFADQQAIHVGAAEIPAESWKRWNAAGAPKPDATATGKTVILDFSFLVVLSGEDAARQHELIGQTLLDQDQAEIGTISAIVIDRKAADDARPEYIVVENGGFLGVGRHEYAIPFGLIEVESQPSRYLARLTRDVLENAPAFDSKLPISRREEQSICGYYGTIPYWDK